MHLYPLGPFATLDLLWFLLSLFVLIAIVRSLRDRREPLRTLKLRYAKGELSKEQFEQMKTDIA